MHYHLEIVMPPTEDIKAAVSKIMAPFDENHEEGEDHDSRHAFWDFWVIGGRFAGTKVQASYDPQRLEFFHEALKERKVTVSGMTWGKQELQPTSQIPMVDALWKEFFPQFKGEHCPLFNHSNNQYSSESLLPEDVSLFKDVVPTMKCSRIIFAGLNYKTELAAIQMYQTDFWNGVSWQDSKWEGDFSEAVKMFNEGLEHYKDEYKEKVTPKPDWLVVTVDYHT